MGMDQEKSVNSNIVVCNGLQVAPLWRRTLAYLIDISCVGLLVYICLFISVGFLSALGITSSVYSFALFMGILLTVVFDCYYWMHNESGSTYSVGKRFFGLEVVSLTGASVTAKQCLIRTVLRWVECLTIVPCLITVSTNNKRQRLGDYLSGTIVVYAPKDRELNVLERGHLCLA